MIETQDVLLASDGARRFDGYVARASGPRVPGVVVLHDMFGLNEPIRAIADGLAARGFVALVPNLFWRAAIAAAIPYDDDKHAVAWERLKAFDLDQGARDIKVAADWLRARADVNGKVAAVGFCGGGRWAFLAAARAGVDAAAALYGLGISQHLDELPKVTCPVQLHYGLRDQHVPQQEVDTVAAGVQGRPGITVFRYPDAGHSFANPVRPTYHPAAAALALERVDAMLSALR